MRKTYRQNWIVNIFSMLRLFMVRPYKYAKLSMEWEGILLYAQSQDNGFFRFEINAVIPPKPSWYNVVVNLEEPKYHAQKIAGTGQVNIPFNSKYVFVSDIDGNVIERNIPGNRIPEDLIAKIKRAKKNNRIWIENIMAIGPGGEQQLKNISYKFR